MYLTSGFHCLLGDGKESQYRGHIRRGLRLVVQDLRHGSPQRGCLRFLCHINDKDKGRGKGRRKGRRKSKRHGCVAWQ